MVAFNAALVQPIAMGLSVNLDFNLQAHLRHPTMWHGNQVRFSGNSEPQQPVELRATPQAHANPHPSAEESPGRGAVMTAGTEGVLR